LLIRHAEPTANIAGVVAGQKGCTGLTPRGRAQADALAVRLQSDAEQFDVLYSSVLPRAVETAEIVGAALGVTPVRQDCDLCELHPGECDGMSWEEQVRRYGPDDTRDPDQPMSPGGESVRSFDMRVRTALQRLIELHAGESVAVVTHGGFVTASMLALLGAGGLDDARRFVLVPGYTSLTEWARTDATQPWVLNRYNDTGHLSSLS
jgi:probable phosphoglycerate mutase